MAPKSKKKATKCNALGAAITNDVKRKLAAQPQNSHRVADRGGKTVLSCLDQTSLDDFLTRAQMAEQEFEAEKETTIIFTDNTVIKSYDEGPKSRVEGVRVPIPRRPEWTTSTTPDQLERMENNAFLSWRSGLADLEESLDAVMTPYERNLDFWRQLWRVVERSDVVVQIIDSRNPALFRCEDLEVYVKEINPAKHNILLMNKADFLTSAMRRRWKTYFNSINVEVLFFSALRELTNQDVADKLMKNEVIDSDDEADVGVPHGPLIIEDQNVLDASQLLDYFQTFLPEVNGERTGVVGMVGYPNVGKSSVINALIGAKKVSVSRQPGKTKHFQTLPVPGFPAVTLCDCPGLVFPSIVKSREELVISAVVPLDHMREFLPSMQLVVEKVGYKKCLKQYGCASHELEIPRVRGYADPTALARALLSAFAFSRGYHLKHDVPDLHRGAKRMLRDYCTGALLYCEHPDDGLGKEEDSDDEDDSPTAGGSIPSYMPLTAGAGSAMPLGDIDELDEDFRDLLKEAEDEEKRLTRMNSRMTKRKMRFMNKSLGKHKMGVSVTNEVSGRMAHQHALHPVTQAERHLYEYE